MFRQDTGYFSMVYESSCSRGLEPHCRQVCSCSQYQCSCWTCLARPCGCFFGRSLALVSVTSMLMLHVAAIIATLGHRERRSLAEHAFGWHSGPQGPLRQHDWLWQQHYWCVWWRLAKDTQTMPWGTKHKASMMEQITEVTKSEHQNHFKNSSCHWKAEDQASCCSQVGCHSSATPCTRSCCKLCTWGLYDG